MWLRLCALVAAAATPGLINLSGAVARPAATVTSLIVLIALALEPTFRFREQWSNYRATEQYLDKERILFKTGSGPYQGLEAEQAFHRLVERVESAIEAENAATLPGRLGPEGRANGSG